jgi:hypothetical protein
MVTVVSIYSQKAVKMTDAFERKTLRQISGPMQAERVRRIRCEEIYESHDNIALSTFLCLKRLQWAGHASHTVRMDDSCIPKNVMGCFRGKSHMGKLQKNGMMLFGGIPKTFSRHETGMQQQERLQVQGRSGRLWPENMMMMMTMAIMTMTFKEEEDKKQESVFTKY